MSRLAKLLAVFLVIAVTATITASATFAGPLTRLFKEIGESAGSAGKRLDGPTALLDEGVSLTKKLPRPKGGASLALLPTANGVWQLIAADGKSVALSSLDDLPRRAQGALERHGRPLAGDLPSTKASNAATIQIAIREQDFFNLRDRLEGLPKATRPVLVRQTGSSYPLKQIPHQNRKRLAIELAPDVLIDPANQRALDGNIKFLSRPLNKANLKIVRFASAGKPAAPAASTMIADLKADDLTTSLARFKNKMLVLSGKITSRSKEGTLQLVVRDGKTLRTIDLETFQAAAERQRVNLMIVESSSPVQPGKAWFRKTALEKRFANARSAMTQAELLAAVSPPGATALIRATDNRHFRLLTTTTYTPSPVPQVPATNANGGFLINGWLLDTGLRAGLHTVYSNHEDPDHTEDIASRWLPWISNTGLLGLGAIITILFVLGYYAVIWWMALWRFVARMTNRDGNSSATLRAIQILTFLPFVAVVALPALVWFVLADWPKLVFWPVRKAFGLISSIVWPQRNPYPSQSK